METLNVAVLWDDNRRMRYLSSCAIHLSTLHNLKWHQSQQQNQSHQHRHCACQWCGLEKRG
eukprot:743875-Pelagomonas_calceolata.AAC.3